MTRVHMRRAGRGIGRLRVHLLNVLSNLLGDDAASRAARRWLLRLAGARLAKGASLHGGSYFTGFAGLSIGEDSFVNRRCYFDVEARVTLGARVTVGHGCTFITTRHELGPSERRAGPFLGDPITIGDGSWVAANVTILPGVTIGPGTVVGAGAVVTESMPGDVLVVGVPARVIRRLPKDAERAPRPAVAHLAC